MSGKRESGHDIKERLARIEENLAKLVDSRPYSRPGKVVTLKEIKERIMDEVVRLFGVSKNNVYTGSRRGTHTQARCMAILLFHKHLGATKTDIAELFGHSQPNIVSIRIKVFEHVTTGRPVCSGEKRFEKVYTKEFLRMYAEADQRITDFKTAPKQ